MVLHGAAYGPGGEGTLARIVRCRRRGPGARARAAALRPGAPGCDWAVENSRSEEWRFPSGCVAQASPLRSGGQGGSIPAAAITIRSRNRKRRIFKLESRQFGPLFKSPGLHPPSEMKSLAVLRNYSKMTLTQLPVLDAPPPSIDLQALEQALRNALGAESVRADRVTRALYATDASVYQIVPLLVAFPATASDVQAIVRICRDFRVPITARGGGTSQAGPGDRARRDRRLLPALRPGARDQPGTSAGHASSRDACSTT